MESSSVTKPTTPEEAARSLFERLGRQDLTNPGDLWGPDAVDNFVPVGEFHGTDAIVGFFAGFFAAVPDVRLEVERILADGSWTTVQYRVIGTFTGAPFLGVDPTGRRIELQAVSVAEWDDQLRIRQNTIYYDGAEFARQIGMLPPRDSAADRAMTSAFNAMTKLRARLKRS